MRFKDYFNTYDTVGTQHTGFLQAMNLSGLTQDITFLNELTMSIMDAHLYNELSESLVMRQWARYMHYSKTNERFEIWAQFYTDFVSALAAKLYRKEEWFKLKGTDFTSLSATDIKTIEHGVKETDTEYGQGLKTSVYGQDQTTTQYGQKQDTNQYGATKVTRDYDKVVVDIDHEMDTHVIGAAHTATAGTATNKLYPLGASDFVNDTQQITSGTADANAQTNTDTWGDHTTTTDARKDEEAADQHTDTITKGQHTDTETRSARTDTVTDAQKTDKQTIKAYTDTERHTKHIVVSPDKYYEIEKELADIGIYDLMLEAVRETMLLSIWDFERGEYLW